MSLWGRHWDKQLPQRSLSDHVLAILSLDQVALDDGVDDRA